MSPLSTRVLFFGHCVLVYHMTTISIARYIMLSCFIPAGISSTSSLQKEQ